MHLIPIEGHFNGHDSMGYDTISVPFTHLMLSIAHYHEAPQCESFYLNSKVFPARFELNGSGRRCCVSPVIGWIDLQAPRNRNIVELKGRLQVRADMDRDKQVETLLPGWTAPPRPDPCPFWGGIFDNLEGRLYIDPSEHHSDYEAGVAAARLAEGILKSEIRSYISNSTALLGTPMKTASYSDFRSTPLNAGVA